MEKYRNKDQSDFSAYCVNHFILDADGEDGGEAGAEEGAADALADPGLDPDQLQGGGEGHLLLLQAPRLQLHALDALVHAVHEREHQELPTLKGHNRRASLHLLLATRDDCVRRCAESNRAVDKGSSFPLNPASGEKRDGFGRE